MIKKFFLTLLLASLCATSAFAEGNDANATLLLHMDGTNGSTTIPDTSIGGGHGNADVTSGAHLTTAEFKFPTASLILNGTSDFISYGTDADWPPSGTDDFTFDMQIWLESVQADEQFMMLGQFENNDSRWFASVTVSGDGLSTSLRIYARHDGTLQFSSSFNTGTKLLIQTWYHIEFGRDGNNFRAFVNGTQVGSTLDVTGKPFSDAIADLTIGAYTSIFFNGQIDELRISDIVRNTSNFTPPTEEYDDQPPPSGRRFFLD